MVLNAGSAAASSADDCGKRLLEPHVPALPQRFAVKEDTPILVLLDGVAVGLPSGSITVCAPRRDDDASVNSPIVGGLRMMSSVWA